MKEFDLNIYLFFLMQLYHVYAFNMSKFYFYLSADPFISHDGIHFNV